jgi:hypothetical protein
MDLRKNCYILKMMRLMAIFIFAAVFWMTQSSIAFGEILDSDCHALKLKAAQGVSQSQIHTYEFSGTCNINALLENGPKVEKTVPSLPNRPARHQFDRPLLQHRVQRCSRPGRQCRTSPRL